MTTLHSLESGGDPQTSSGSSVTPENDVVVNGTEFIESELHNAHMSEVDAVARKTQTGTLSSSVSASASGSRTASDTLAQGDKNTSANASPRPSFTSSGTSTPDPDAVRAAKAIPTSFWQSAGYWWASDEKNAEESEVRLLKRLSFFRTANQPDPEPTSENPDALVARLSRVSVGNPPDPKRYINTVTFTSPALEAKYKSTESEGHRDGVVLLHGYGAGLAFFYLNWDTIARASAAVGRKAFACDWLGMGRSSRPSPKELSAGKNATEEERVNKAETFFTDSLEQWRIQQGLDRMTLIGHSLGGYLSIAYALKYPTRVDRLILLSPAGIPRQEGKPEKNTDIGQASAARNVERELTEPQQETQTSTKELNQVKVEENGEPTIEKPSAEATTDQKVPETQRGPPKLVRKLFVSLWDSGLSPFSFLRALGPWGPMVAGNYSRRRFGSLPDEDIKDMHNYIWTITRARGSSEHCISHLLKPGAYARMPMVDRIHNLKMPVTFQYGDRDWMDPQGGLTSVEILKRQGNSDCKVIMIKNAGHHNYLDNAAATNRALRDDILALGGSKAFQPKST